MISSYKKSNIAVVGIAFRLPGDISTCEELWDVLQNGENLISNINEKRFPFKKYLHPRKTEAGKSYTFNAGILSKIDEFDANFFGITPREAMQMDPQQRLLLETTWEALENGNQHVEQLAGSNCSVFIGIGSNENIYNYVNDTSAADSYTMIGNCSSIAANRISYVFDFHGPSMSIDTACSSSLVALHQACSSIWNGEASMAIAGGVNLFLSPTSFIGFAKASMLSPEGQCKSFAAEGNGYVRSEGCVVLFLKPLEVAERDGDTIHAVILNSGVNSDGRTNGITMPSAEAQASLITKIHDQIGVPAENLSYLEAHGTGTVVGDQIEALAIGTALGKKRDKHHPLLIGSVKSNLGHLEVVSGLTGVLKTILCLQHKTIPATLHFENPNPHIPFNELNIKVVNEAIKLPQENKPAIMAVNSFGFGGTNAHVVLAEYIHPVKKTSVSTPQPLFPPLLLSVRDSKTLPILASQYLQFISDNPDNYYDIAYTLAHRRTIHEQSTVVYGDHLLEIIQGLEQISLGKHPIQTVSENQIGKNLSVALVYSGNGSQWQGMAAELLKTEPLFAETIEEIDSIFSQYADFSIKSELLASVDNSHYDCTEVAQPCIFAVQVAITRFLMKHGVQIGAVTGHSVGEITAAWASGALTLAQAIEVIYARSFWQGKTRGQGKMLAVALGEEDARHMLMSHQCDTLVDVAAINSPKGITFAGDSSALKKLQEICCQQGIFNRLLDLDYAFHTKQMDSIREGVLNSLAELKSQKNTITYVSTVSGIESSGEQLDANYWWHNIRQPVQFNAAINTLLDSGVRIFIEIGPNPVLKRYIEECFATRAIRGLVIPTLRVNSDQISELKKAAYRTWVSGAQFDSSYYFPVTGQSTILPPFPWSRDTYSFNHTNENTQEINLCIVHPLLGWRIKVEESIWENHLDTTVVSYLADHIVDNVAIMPAAGFVEMALAASKNWYGNELHDLRDLEILSPMVFDERLCRLVRFELQAHDGSFLIKSRPRHSEETWLVHVVGRLIAAPIASSTNTKIAIETLQAEAHASCDGNTLYNNAKAIGLTYGPMFQSIADMWMTDNHGLAQLNLHDDVAFHMQNHCLYPGLLDACFQLLIGLLAYDNPKQETVLPVRIGRLQLLEKIPQEIYVTAKILVKSKQSVLASFMLLDKEGRIVAIVNDCRFKKTYFSEQASKTKIYACNPFLLTPFRDIAAITDIDALQQQVQERLTRENDITVNHFESILPLMDLMVRCFIHQAIQDLAGNLTTFTLSSFSTASEIAPSQLLLLKWCFNILLEDGLLVKDEEQYTFVPQDDELNGQVIWQLLITHYPIYLAETLLLGRIGLHLIAILKGEVSAQDLLYSARNNNILKQFLEDSPFLTNINTVVCNTVSAIATAWPSNRRIRVLDIGYSVGGLTRELIELFPSDKTDYHLVVADENLSFNLEGNSSLQLTVLSSASPFSEIDQLIEAKFDVIIIRNYLHEAQDNEHVLVTLRKLLAIDGVLLITEQCSSRYYEFILGSQPSWWNQSIYGEPISRLASAKYYQEQLKSVGFNTTEPFFELGGSHIEGAFVLLAQSPIVEVETTANLEEKIEDILMFTSSKKSIAPLYEAIQAIHKNLSMVPIDCYESEIQEHLISYCKQEKKLHIVCLFNHEESIQQAAKDCAVIVNLIKAIQNIQWMILPRLTLVTHNAMPFSTDIASTFSNPVHATVWGVGRVLMNEYSDLHCNLIDLQGDSSTLLAENFASEILSFESEREVIINTQARYGLRINYTDLTPQSSMNHFDYRLDFKHAGSLNNLQWIPTPTVSLAADEVMIKPHSSGLNFRDLMYAMGFIPDEAVENGFLGPTLGMEFAGEIIVMGESVTDFSIGDKVMGFAPASFSSVAVTKAHAITALPSKWTYAAAATIPIAFFTAYYAIHHLARLQKGERILIHGAAGGVGIAAIQVAKHIGAEIYATAGSSEKRDFLKLMGITHLYDSRTLLFADEILIDTDHEGVDVVLNCLAGEAIQANLTIIKPFGRFLELGKRDFFANSKMGLRPFRNNISYFGIDADQLLIKNPALCTKLFKEIMALFEQDVFTPLPYREFSAHHIHDAFRYMQQSQHIGKVVVNLDKKLTERLISQPTFTTYTLSAHALYIVTGGLSGFGLQTAKWLVDKGAKHLILINRSGVSSEEAVHAIKDFEEKGILVSVKALDISDAKAVDALMMDLKNGSLPVKGIIHAATVYDDALVQNLDLKRINNVFAPKAQGAWNLHCSTLDIPLDFFVVYSSVTTLFGNPGQANYVAANTYLESLVAYRRALGLKGIYISWGPIADVGYLARNENVKNLLTAQMGSQILNSHQALQVLEELIRMDIAGVTFANLNISKMQRSLSACASPKFSNLLKHNQQITELANEQTEDIRALIENKTAEEALAIVTQILTNEIAKILRFPIEKIDKDKSLLNIGIDSLIGAELTYAIEQRFAIQIPMLALLQGLSVETIAKRILDQLYKEEEKTQSTKPEIADILYQASLHGEELSGDVALDVINELQEELSVME